MKRGFTLIELLAVVLIMGILTAIALPQYRRSVERTRVAEALQMLPALYESRERYVAESEYFDGSLTYEQVPADKKPLVTFARLDIEMKGQPGTNAQSWVTDTFKYTIAPSAFVGAIFTKGIYNGLGVAYAGNSQIRCCYTKNNPPKDNPAYACDVLNLPLARPMEGDSFCQQLANAF